MIGPLYLRLTVSGSCFLLYKILIYLQVLVLADKTCNIYKLDIDEYKKLTTEAVTSTYKKVPDKINDKISIEGKRIMENKTIQKQTECLLMVRTIASSL